MYGRAMGYLVILLAALGSANYLLLHFSHIQGVCDGFPSEVEGKPVPGSGCFQTGSYVDWHWAHAVVLAGAAMTVIGILLDGRPRMRWLVLLGLLLSVVPAVIAAATAD